MIGDKGPRQKPGRVIRARDLNRSTRMGESLARVRLGYRQAVVDGIPLALPAVVPGLRYWGTIGAGVSVAAGATASVTLTQSSNVVTAKNKWDTAIPSKASARKVRVAIDEYGDWIFESWDC